MGWNDAGGLPTIHKWRGTLGGGENFGGRLVYESGSGASDTCWFPGSQFAKVTGVTGGTWSVDELNRYGPDSAGWGQNVVQYYRANNRVPCGVTVPQTIAIRCNVGGDKVVSVHTIGAAITATTVQSFRDGVTVTRTWP